MTALTLDAPPRDALVRSAPFQLVRADDEAGDGLTLDGYAAMFGRETYIDSWEGSFIEVIAPGAFKKSIRERTPRMQFDHGHHPLIGSIPIGVITELAEDARGLHVVGRLSDNWLIEPVRDAIRDGAIDGMSFRFRVVRESWTDSRGKTVRPEDLRALLYDAGDRGPLTRTLKEVRVDELGPVVWPAYEATSVGMRARSLAHTITNDEELRQQVRRSLTDHAAVPGDLDDPQLRRAVARALLFNTDAPPAEGHPSTRDTRSEDAPPAEGHPSNATDAPPPGGHPSAPLARSHFRDRVKRAVAARRDPRPESHTGGSVMGAELTHPQAVNRLKDIRDEMERLAAKETPLTVEDEQYFADLEREHDEVDEHRKRLERASAMARVRAVASDPKVGRIERGVPYGAGDGGGYDLDPILNPDSVEDRRFRDPWDLSEVRTFGRSKAEVGQEMRARALAAVEKMHGATDKIRSAATDILEQWDDDNASIARLALATSSPEYLRAWSKMARGNGHMVTVEEQQALERAMSLTDAQGGYLVPFQLDPTVIITSAGSLNEIRKAARQVVATSDVWNGVSAGAVQWRWAAEGSEAGDNAPGFQQPTVPVHRADGFVPISIEALQDEANVTAEVGRLLAAGKDSLEAVAFITGSGVGQPTGITTALGAGQQINAATDNVIVGADVLKPDNALPARYRDNASWLAHRSIYNLIRGLGANGGSDMWERIGENMPARLLGRPAYEAEAMESTSSLGVGFVDKALIFGDFSNYVIADRIGMTVELIPHLFGAASRFPTGQRGWFAHYRVGADSVNDDAFRVLML